MGHDRSGEGAARDTDLSAEQVAQRAAAAMVRADAAARSAGIRLLEVGPGAATAAMTVADGHVNGHGVCHGGYLFLLADTAMAYASNSHGVSAVASGADIAFLRPAVLGDELRAEAVERALTGRSGLYDVTVRDGGGALVAEFRGRTRQVPGLPPPPPVG
jgi:acyl-CoA thioesterase